MASSTSTANTVMRRQRIEPPRNSSTDRTCCEESKSAGQKKGGASSIPRLTAPEKVIQDTTELAPASRQRVLHPGRCFRMHRPLDQSCLFQICQPRGQRG